MNLSFTFNFGICGREEIRTYTRLVEKVKISLIGTLIDMSKLKSNANNYQIVRILKLVVHFSFPNNTGGRERKHQPDGS
jgi:hypothetical protein